MRKLFLILMTVLACSWSMSAQTKTIKGTVLDAANNEPLIGATIMPVGGGQGCQADIDGKFTLTVPTKVTKATISYVGYTPQTVTLTDGMTVYLASTSTDLEDVIVVAYGTANKESLTGSVAVVGAAEIEDRPVTSVTAALEGNAPGVQVNNAIGTPGQAPTIRIRGFSSIKGDNNPLYVVDGMPYETGINDLNPNDIESISVLKDAASCALYGNKGSNGVILITTKKAKKAGKIDVNVSISQGMYNRGLPHYERLGTNQWMESVWTGYYNQLSQTSSMSPDEISAYLQEKLISDTYIRTDIYGDPAGLFTADGKLTRNILPGYADDLDWWDAVSRSGYRQEYGINAAAATEKFNVFASLGYLNEKGYLLKTSFERFTARINTNFTPTSYLRFGINLMGNAQNGDQNDNAGAADTNSSNPFNVDNYSPIYPYYSHDAEGNVIKDANGNPVWSTAPSLGGLNMGYYLRLNQLDYTYAGIDGTAYATAVLPYGFELTFRGNYTRNKTNYKQYINNITGNGVSFNGIYYEDSQNTSYSTFMQQLNWAHDYGMHHVDVLLDHENFQWHYDYFYAQMQDQTIEGIYAFPNFVEMTSISGGIEEDRTESYLGRARYNYAQKYFVDFSFRRDGSSRFAKENRWGNFWSIGAGWVITKEKFMNALPWVNFAKLRAAYGTVGNNASAKLYNFYTTYALMPYFNTNAARPVNFGSENLKWETTKSFDIALEGSLFDDRLSFSIGYYDKRSTDLIFSVAMPRSAGSTNFTWLNPTVTQNIGTMSNRGWELSFGVDIIRNRDFLWTASIDASFLSNKVIKLPQGKDISNGMQRHSEGHSIYEWYTVHYAGVDQLTGNALYELDPNAYEFTYLGENGAAQFEQKLKAAQDANALVVINGKYYVTDPTKASNDWRGTALPTVYGSFGTNFSWKGISLGMLFTYSLGGQTYDSNYVNLMNTSDPKGLQSALHKDILNSWTQAPEGMTEDSPNRIDPNGIPQLNFANAITNNGTSDRWLTSSDYLVFKNLNISYSLPSKWLTPLQLQDLKVGFSVDNLFTITSRKGLNPQESFAGSVSRNFVTARVFSFTINAKF